jgi:hypothetical protein
VCVLGDAAAGWDGISGDGVEPGAVNFTRDYRSKQGAQVFGSARLRGVAIVCFCWLAGLACDAARLTTPAFMQMYSPAIQCCSSLGNRYFATRTRIILIGNFADFVMVLVSFRIYFSS